jgi:two-component system chemotaxis response regulator CheB
MQSRLIRVLVVDDSLVMRSLLRMVLASDPMIELAGMAADGASALDAIERLKPDLILLDIEMPRMSGIEVLTKLRARKNRVQVIMCSTLTRRGAGITLEALALGATDYVTKPTAQHGAADAVATLMRELLPKIKGLFLSEVNEAAHSPMREPQNAGMHKPGSIVVLGVSTGGPVALEALLPQIPRDFPVPIVIAQHMPRLFTALLAERLDRVSELSVREAVAGERAAAGCVYLAPGDGHLQLTRTAFDRGFAFRLVEPVAGDFCRPSVDVLFHSAANVCGEGAIGVVLTGMGSDGLEGCRAIRKAGGQVLVQDRATSAVWGMPGAIAEAGLAHRVLPLHAIAAELVRLCAPQAASIPAKASA